jgi:phosphoglycolate phosphatase-like HAD superfamily hydrolase
MNLAIVDIDGTLTNTSDIDAECYVRVVSAFLGHSFSTDWSAYEDVTDSGIVEELCREYLGRSPTTAEMASVESAFVSELVQASRERPDAFASVSGASEFLERSRAAGWQVALATGAWGRSAELKLRAAGLTTDLPLASANDSQQRIGIVRRAIESVMRVKTNDDRIVLVGDAMWDLETAKQLDLPFIGIASGDRAALLRASGATHVFADFRDLQSMFAALNVAGVP